MKMDHNLLYRINLIVFFFVCSINVQAQNDTEVEQAENSTKMKHKYGLRVGVDLSTLLKTVFDDDYKGFEVVGDYRVSKNIYAAAEIGSEEKNTVTDYLNNTSKGNYFKVGVDYNMYDNWLDMNNMIYLGLRAAGSTFSQDLNSATVYTTNQYWSPQLTLQDKQEFNGLTAFWTEILIGIKAEIANNLFMGLNVQLKFLVSESNHDNFENVYIPGFGKTYDSGAFGTGFSYTITYLIPFYKKEK